MVKLFNNSVLEKAISASWLRNEAIADNMANIDTPGYKRKDVNFQDYLKVAINKDSISGVIAHPKHIPLNNDLISNGNFRITRDYNDTTMRMDGNNVDIDAEMAEMAKNQILFNAYVTLLNKDFGLMRTAIREGR